MALPRFGKSYFIYCTECFMVQPYFVFGEGCDCVNKNVVRTGNENRQEIDRKRKQYLRQQKLKRILSEE